MPAQPRRLQSKGGLGRGAEDDALAAEIDHGAAGLRGEIRAQRVNALKHRLGRLPRSALAQARQLRLRGARGEEEQEEDDGPAHQSITPDQSGSEPSSGVVTWRGSGPSSAMR